MAQRATSSLGVIASEDTVDTGFPRDSFVSAIVRRNEVLHSWSRRCDDATHPCSPLTESAAEDSLRQVIDYPVIPGERNIRRASFVVLQEWEGYVIHINKNYFTGRLTDVTGGGLAESEEAEFPIEDVSKSDRALMKEGAIFRWTIGYKKQPSGSKQRVSVIVFRRLPQWTTSELKQAEQRARSLHEALNWE